MLSTSVSGNHRIDRADDRIQTGFARPVGDHRLPSPTQDLAIAVDDSDRDLGSADVDSRGSAGLWRHCRPSAAWEEEVHFTVLISYGFVGTFTAAVRRSRRRLVSP